ncbi:hypothetical protein DFJ73DRAFT_955046 [Zopfochytrium polystomum]|nr:hypothetical protein DFJ73DRAFT_955046 [Zopfochytrium polystomum]
MAPHRTVLPPPPAGYTRIPAFPRPPPAVIAACIRDIAAALGDPTRVSTAKDLIDRRSHDTTYHKPHPPDAVAFAKSERDIAAILSICNRHKVPVIPLAGGSSIEAHVVPTEAGGIVLDINDMDKIVELHKEDLDVVVEPGVGWMDLRDILEPQGLFFPPDPGASACIGGMCGTNCSGTLAYRYGTMKDNVLSLRVVLADGTVIKTRRRAVKSSAGYDLTRLFIGSEGTLGIVSQATLRLRRSPSHTTVAIAQFKTLRAAAAAVHKLVLSGTPFQRLELMDAVAVRAVNLHDLNPGEKSPFADQTTLLAECAAFSQRGIDEQVAAFRETVAAHGAAGTSVATSPTEAERLWNLRKKCYFSVPALRTHPSVVVPPGAKPPKVGVLVTDVAVPISRLGDAMEATEILIREEGLIGPMLVHAGDGNCHCLLVLDEDDPREIEAAERVREKLGVLALSMDGTVTGEHGLGQGKRGLFEKEADGPTLELMKTLKLAIDPNNILNPGKIFVPGESKTSSHL